MLLPDEVVGVFLLAAISGWIALLITAPKLVDERITQNKDEWLKSHKKATERLSEPREWLRQATLFWMVAWLLFAIQLVLQSTSSPVISVDTDDVALGLGFLFLGAAVFRTYHLGEFFRDRTYYPRVGLVLGLVLFLVLLIDVSYLVLLALTLPYFFVASWYGKVFMGLLIASLLDSMLFLRVFLTKRRISGGVNPLITYIMTLPAIYFLGLVLYFAVL